MPPSRPWRRRLVGVMWTVLLGLLILCLLRLKPLAAIAPAMRVVLFVLGPVSLLVLCALIGFGLWRRMQCPRSSLRR